MIHLSSRWIIVRIIKAALVLVGLIGVIGPWPVSDAPYTASASFRDTLARIPISPGKRQNEPIRVGAARVDITPTVPVPLAGFIGQILDPYVGVNAPCSAQAITIASPNSSVTILGADLLLIDDRMARAVLARTGLPREQIYFTATHSHSGPGGWGLHPLERLVAGTYDPEQFDHLVDRLAEVVNSSRARLQPAEVAFVQGPLPGLQRNRILPDQPTNDTLSAWIFRATASRAVLATLASFGAHATVAHPVPPRLGGDYPGAFAASLARRGDSGVVLFAAGTVGDASPVRLPAANQQKGAEAYAEVLVDEMVRLLGSARFDPTIDLTNVGYVVDLPPVQVPMLSASLRFSPLFVWWVGRRTTYLHAVRIGPAVLAGFPGDYSGHLATGWRSDLPVVATSFNGDYKGYLVSRATFRDHPCYETRAMSFFGPDLGDSLTALMQGCIDRLTRPGP